MVSPRCDEYTPGVMVKQETGSDLVDSQMNFWMRVPERNRPSGLHRIRPCIYLYTKVEGSMPCSEDASLIWSAVKNTVWSWVDWTDDLDMDTRWQEPSYSYKDYCDYVELRGGDYDLMMRVATHTFTPARTVHGDLTIENLLIASGVVVFLDPGRPILLVRELDEAKLLQSWVTQWEALKGTGPVWECVSIPFTIRYVHIALLYSHWVRLLGHDERHTSSVLKIGRDTVLPELEQILREAPENDSELDDRHRRCLDRLEEACLRMLPTSI